jgi:hypothetical protein
LVPLALVLADFLNPNQGPQQTGDFRVSPGFFVGVLGIGFLVGAIGHVVRSRTLVAVGILMIFLATVLIPIALNATR